MVLVTTPSTADKINDYLVGNGGDDLIYGNLGNDQLQGDLGNETEYGGQGNDMLNGDAGNDIIYGNFGDDTAYGGEGNDTVYGGQGNDVLFSDGGNDQDRLFGNLGADTFDFATFDQTPPMGIVTDATADRIADFESGVEKIKLDLSDFADNTPDYVERSAPGVNSLVDAITVATNTGAILNNEVIFVAGATDGFLLINANGDGSIGGPNEFAIVLQGANNLAAFGIGDVDFML